MVASALSCNIRELLFRLYEQKPLKRPKILKVTAVIVS